MRQQFSRRHWLSYIVVTGATFLCVIALVGVFNYLIDPLDIFGSTRFGGLNKVKPHLEHHRELSRFVKGVRLCGNTAIFGNSRAEIGLDPENPLFAAHGMAAFDHAIPGTDASTIYRQLIWLEAARCSPQTIFMGVEFFDFLGGAAPKQIPTLASDPVPRVDARVLSEVVFSIAGLRDSLDTIAVQRSKYPATATDRGFNPLLNYIAEVQQSGHYRIFRQKAEDNLRAWRRKPMRIRTGTDGPSNNEIMLDAILRHDTRIGATTYLIIYPYHAQIRLIIERLGMGGIYADWKRLVVAYAERERQRGGKVEVWDFSGISPETLESIPAKNDRTSQLRNYWEAGHFKKALGDMALERIFGGNGEFGMKLDNQNIEGWLQKDRKQVQALLASPSSLVTELDSFMPIQAKK